MSTITKKAIANAFLEIAQHKPIDSITVKDIVSACGIARQTFYYHFQDILDVIEWSLNQHSEALLKESLEAPTLREAMRVLVFSLEERDDKPDILHKLLRSQKREQVAKLLLETVRSYLLELIRRQEIFADLKQADLDTALAFYSFAIIGVLLENSRKQNVNLEQLSDQLYRLICGQITPEHTN